MQLPFDNRTGRGDGAEASWRVHERRRDVRLPFAGPVTIAWVACEHPNLLDATLIEASERGMSAKASVPLSIGLRVWVLLSDGTDGRAEVRDCTPLEGGHRVGFQFIAERRDEVWSGGHPKHVLEWIDSSGRLVSSFVSLRQTENGTVELEVPEVVPCPDIVMLSEGGRRLLCCTRDWRPEQDCYVVQVELLRDIVAG